jgi:hypothetical protein
LNNIIQFFILRTLKRKMDKLFILTKKRINLIAEAMVAAGLSPHPMLDVVWLGSGRPIVASYAGYGLVGAPGP